MQDRYAGDIGDYVKLALLRAPSFSLSLVVRGWLCNPLQQLRDDHDDYDAITDWVASMSATSW